MEGGEHTHGPQRNRHSSTTQAVLRRKTGSPLQNGALEREVCVDNVQYWCTPYS